MAGFEEPVTSAACYVGSSCSQYFNYDALRTNPDPADTRPCPSPDNPDDVPADIKEYGCDCVLPTRPGEPVASTPHRTAGSFFGTEIEGGRCGAMEYGLHATMTNVATCYGSNGRLGWGASLDFTITIDGSDWDGVSVWVRSATGERRSLIMSVVDTFAGGGFVDPETGVSCISMDPPPGAPPTPDNEKCDAFGTAVTTTDEWTFVPARFSELKQKGFGVPAPRGEVDPSQIARVQFLVTAGDWDLWIDDIALFRDRE